MDNLLYAFWKDWIQDGGDTKCYLIWSAPCLFRIVPHRTLSSVSFSLVIDIPRDKDSNDVLEILYSDPHYARPELNISISPVSYVESYGYHAVNRHTGGRTRCPLKSAWAFSLASMSFGLGWQKKRAYIRCFWTKSQDPHQLWKCSTATQSIHLLLVISQSMFKREPFHEESATTFITRKDLPFAAWSPAFSKHMVSKCPFGKSVQSPGTARRIPARTHLIKPDLQVKISYDMEHRPFSTAGAEHLLLPRCAGSNERHTFRNNKWLIYCCSSPLWPYHGM